MAKVIKYGLRILAWIVLALLALLLIVILLLQTKPIKKRIVTLIEYRASHYIYPQLTIGEIDGNFLSHLELKKIALTNQKDTIAFLNELKARYNLLSLLKHKLEIRSLEIIHPFVRLAQLHDSTWNVSHMMKPVQHKTSKDILSSTKSYTIDLAAVKLTQGLIAIQSFDTLIPQRIQDLNTTLSLQWGSIQTLKMND